MKSALSLSLWALLSLAAADSAKAITVANTSFSFTGNCALGDCTGQGRGTLTVSGYTGTALSLTNSNFVSFAYQGTDLLGPFTVLAANLLPNSVSGSIGPTFPGAYNVSFATSTLTFSSNTGGGWAICTSQVTCGANNANDQGTGANFATAATPEPSSIALLAAGLVGLGLRRRLR